MKKFNEIKAWKELFEFPLLGRQGKPRDNGLTMIIDKGLGLTETRELLDLAADYIDSIKLGFGTSAFYSHALLAEKIRLVTSYGVDIFPGGTFLEVAVLQGKLPHFLDTAKDLGFTAVEVSDGTINMPQRFRTAAIKEALKRGFKVVAEVGKKDPRDMLETDRICEQIEKDLEDGAFKVIVEGRESGKGVVIYDSQGAIKDEDLRKLLDNIKDPDRILWEAPLKAQQQALIMQFGPNVNLGNVQPNEILALEALRVGLRGDTLRACLKAKAVLPPLFKDDENDSATAEEEVKWC
ncbi:phosphosulfolactate synthase [Metallumcola ferriviriculae]|uniref:Phosphosulfolactate synthase n=1 Tax=Metallumcola ferriviriculae TaxID=3039180 RepID=A0AAU0UJS1_9FIRM|nr:phosphosulfolactate synthase [Desulfitibacteraceae bacterium MK1]